MNGIVKKYHSITVLWHIVVDSSEWLRTNAPDHTVTGPFIEYMGDGYNKSLVGRIHFIHGEDLIAFKLAVHIGVSL